MQLPLEYRVQLPEAPAEPQRRPFPVIMFIAPVVVAVVMFSLTSSKHMLLFAALGPVLSTASWLESRRSSRRLIRRERARLERELREAKKHIDELHDVIRAERRRRHPLIPELLQGIRPARTVPDGRDSKLVWCVGTAATSSGITIEGAPGRHEALLELARHARFTSGCPITTSSAELVVVGEPVAARATVAALRVQGQAMGLSDDELDRRIRRVAGTNGCRTSGCAELHLDTPVLGFARLIDDDGERIVTPERASVAELARWRDIAGSVADSGSLLEQAAQFDLGTPNNRRGSLAAPLGVSSDGHVVVDLVADGPHAVIGGTTGSGKSELLITWIAGLAARHSPKEFVFLGLDFKGGATFDPLIELPHCAGVVTDLDGEDEAQRCAESLAAEIVRRERLLRAERRRDVDELTVPPPRLVVVVDEFQTLLTRHPRLQQLFADLGARGRSLGIHLILCTQRPHAAARDALMANCSIRVCLRVTANQESQAVIGTDDAASIPAAARGRAYIDVGNGPVEAQAPLCTPRNREEIAERWHDATACARLVHPALPTMVEGASVRDASPAAYAIGDRPDEQWQGMIQFEPGLRAIVLGGSGSGKTTALRALAHAAANTGQDLIRMSTDPGTAWLQLRQLQAGASNHPRMLIIDDLDALGHRLDEARRHEFAESLAALLRSANDDLSVALTLQRPNAPWSNVLANCTTRLLLRSNTKQDYLLAGGDPALWNERAVPGRALLGSTHIHFLHESVWPEGTSEGITVSCHLANLRGDLAVVTRGSSIRSQLESCGWLVRELESPSQDDEARHTRCASRGVAVLGTPEQWIATGGALAASRTRAEILLDQVSAGEFRALLRGHEAPPPTNHRSQYILYRADDTYRLVEPSDVDKVGGGEHAGISHSARAAARLTTASTELRIRPARPRPKQSVEAMRA